MQQMDWTKDVRSADQLTVLAPSCRAEFGAELGGWEAVSCRKGQAEPLGQSCEEALVCGTDVGQATADPFFQRGSARGTEEFGDRADGGPDCQHCRASPTELVRPLSQSFASGRTRTGRNHGKGTRVCVNARRRKQRPFGHVKTIDTQVSRELER